MAPPITLRAFRTPSRASMSVLTALLAQNTATRCPIRPIQFVVLHGFLAHSGSLNTFLTMLRKRLDAHNETTVSENRASGTLLEYSIVSLDARNHGLSPHTDTHTLDIIADDLGTFLASDVSTISAEYGHRGRLHATAAAAAAARYRWCGSQHGLHDVGGPFEEAGRGEAAPFVATVPRLQRKLSEDVFVDNAADPCGRAGRNRYAADYRCRTERRAA